MADGFYPLIAFNGVFGKFHRRSCRFDLIFVFLTHKVANAETLVNFYQSNANLAATNVTENYIILKLEDGNAPVSQPLSTHAIQTCSRRSLGESQ